MPGRPIRSMHVTRPVDVEGPLHVARPLHLAIVLALAAPGALSPSDGTAGPETVLAAVLAERVIDDRLPLREVIESNRTYNDAPELFCFGLLRLLDVRHLVAVIAPREVRFREPGERAKKEMAGLDAWYRLLGADFAALR